MTQVKKAKTVGLTEKHREGIGIGEMWLDRRRALESLLNGRKTL